MDPQQLESLTFRSWKNPRRRRRQAPRPPSLSWVVVSVVAALLFVLAVRALLDRTASTAGVPTASSSAQAAPGDEGEDVEVVYRPPPVPMVYRCVDRAGAVSLQSQPCSPGQRTTMAVPAPPDTRPQRPRALFRPPPEPDAAYISAPTVNPERAQREARCARARRSREQTLESVGLKRTFDLLRRLDDMVAEACKGA